MPCRNFSKGWRNAAPKFSKRPAQSPIAAPLFFKRPAQSVDCRTANSQEAGAIHRLSRRNFPRGRRDPLIAAPQILKKSARYTDCRAAIFQEAGAIR